MDNAKKHPRKAAGLVQISFKVSPDMAKRLDERAIAVGASRHRIARMFVDDGLAAVAAERFGGLPADMAERLNEAVQAVSARLDGLDQSLASVDRKLTAQQDSLVELQRDLVNGVMGLLIQGGQAPERAEAYVRRNLNVPPRKD